jgi:Mn2+/Fe2+ NRAMP family transporter
VAARLVGFLRRLGPGLVAGASDNDPTTVATLAVVGATTGFALSWLVILVLPMLATVQVIASQVGLSARSGLQELVRRSFGRGWGLLLLASILAVNAITIAADLQAGAAALGLLTGLPLPWFILPYAAVTLGLLLVGTYDEVVSILKYVLLVFAAYIAAAAVARPDWSQVLIATINPRLPASSDGVAGALAILGTTLTSYAYVWEVQEEAEGDGRSRPRRSLGLARLDAALGMTSAVAVFWFILVATGATLGAHHEQVRTAQDAARALAPLAGPAARYLFGVGLLASSFIALPVIAATSAYLLCQQLGWRGSLALRPRQAPRFYAVILASFVLASLISYAGVPTIQLLFWASIAGGLGTPASLVFLMLIARSRAGVNRLLRAAGWLTTLIVTGLSVLFIVTQVHQG